MNYRFILTPYTSQRVIEGISITKAGRIGLTRCFITTHGIERSMRANMYWDATNLVIALEFTREADATAYPIRFTRQYGAFINASRFFRLHGLDPTQYARRYSYSKLNGEVIGLAEANASVFVVELKKPMSRSRANRVGTT
jgi:hypothetical protein